MAVIFSDSYTEPTTDTAATSHTPNIGTGYVQVVLTGTAVLQAKAASDQCQASTSGTANGQYLKISPAPSVADVDVQFTIKTVDTGSATRRVRLHARGNGVTDYYAVAFLPTGHASNDTELYKVVGSTKTSLGTIDTGIVANDVFVLEIRTNSQRVLKNGTAILTATDTALTGAGDAGLSMGFVSSADSGNINTVWTVDDFSVTEIVATGLASALTLTTIPQAATGTGAAGASPALNTHTTTAFPASALGSAVANAALQSRTTTSFAATATGQATALPSVQTANAVPSASTGSGTALATTALQTHTTTPIGATASGAATALPALQSSSALPLTAGALGSASALPAFQALTATLSVAAATGGALASSALLGLTTSAGAASASGTAGAAIASPNTLALAAAVSSAMGLGDGAAPVSALGLATAISTAAATGQATAAPALLAVAASVQPAIGTGAASVTSARQSMSVNPFAASGAGGAIGTASALLLAVGLPGAGASGAGKASAGALVLVTSPLAVSALTFTVLVPFPRNTFVAFLEDRAIAIPADMRTFTPATDNRMAVV